jgi:PIN domain nuclease of toxin-antitoxin system
MRVVADSHELIWYALDSPRLSTKARDTIRGAIADHGLVVSVVSLVELLRRLDSMSRYLPSKVKNSSRVSWA